MSRCTQKINITIKLPEYLLDSRWCLHVHCSGAMELVVDFLEHPAHQLQCYRRYMHRTLRCRWSGDWSPPKLLPWGVSEFWCNTRRTSRVRSFSWSTPPHSWRVDRWKNHCLERSKSIRSTRFLLDTVPWRVTCLDSSAWGNCCCQNWKMMCIASQQALN